VRHFRVPHFRSQAIVPALDFFNSSKLSTEAEILRQLIVDDTPISLCPIIYQEILQGIRDDRTFENIKELLLDFNMIDFPWHK
jgi:predicted nucleic acid-binding protein